MDAIRDPRQQHATPSRARRWAWIAVALVAGALAGCGSLATAPRAGADVDSEPDVVSFDDPRLSAERGRRAYWNPAEALEESGARILMFEPRDPARIPVLFVHGAAGSAQDWRWIIDRLDRSRYQPMVFAYPSGAPLESMAFLLYRGLSRLQLQQPNDRLHIVAHSMGGLVVRRALLDHGEQMPPILLFVSISTPWAGEPTAELGVKYSPWVLPSWRDMQPDGPFLQDLFSRRLPGATRHVLMFGFRGGSLLPFRPNNDGTVTLKSQLRPEAQAGAEILQGYDESHDSILSSPAVLERLHTLFADAQVDDQRSRARASAAR